MSSAPRDENREPSLIGESNDGNRTPITIYADPVTHRLLVNATLSGTITNTIPTALISFITTVATAGTRVQLASNAVTNGFILEAPSTNTGFIYVGGSSVSSTDYGAELQPGQSTSIAVDNTNKVYIDSSVSGDKVACIGS